MIESLCALLRGEEAALPQSDAARAALIDLARTHRVHLLLAARLQEICTDSDSLPEDVAALIDDIRLEAIVDELRVRELCRVAFALEDGGAQPVVFKGAALAHTHYAESWQRPHLDVDILIDPATREAAFDRLRALGYERPAFISGELVMHQAPFIRADELGVEHALDVHWRIANPQVVAIALSHAEIRERSQPVYLQSHTFRVPAPVDALLLACLHRAAHHNDTEELLWLYDIHLLASGLSPDDWAQFVERAVSRSVTAIVWRGMQLTIGRFRTQVPYEVITCLAEAPGHADEPSSLFLRKDLRKVDLLRSDLRALGPRAGVRLVREHLFPPAQYMKDTYGVRSHALLPVFYVRRIVSGAAKWLKPSG